MSKSCSVDYKTIENIVGIYGTPCQIYDESVLINQCKKFVDAFENAGFKTGKNFMQYFAVKATPNPTILKIMEKQGFGFDCSSITEIVLTQSFFNNAKIIYTSNFTSTDDLEKIIAYINVGKNITINLDDYDGLINLIEAHNNLQNDSKEVQKNLETSVNTICFRYNPMFGETNSETQSNVLGGENSKFGMSKNRLFESYKKAKQIGIINFGIHVMTGSCIMEPSFWSKMMIHVLETVTELNEKLDIKIKFIDIGGGFGVAYKPDQLDLDIDQVAKNIKKSIDNSNLDWEISIYTESGRYITASCGYLVSRCESIKEDNNQVYYGLDATMANLMRPGMYNSYHHITVPLRDSNLPYISANVVGTLCENNDWFAKNRMLPSGIKKKDLFVIHDTGAHGHSMGFQYNGKLRAPEVIVYVNKNFDIIRCKDTYVDIISKYY